MCHECLNLCLTLISNTLISVYQTHSIVVVLIVVVDDCGFGAGETCL